MKHTCSLVLATVLMAACSAFSAVKAASWTLPADWEENVEYSQDAGYLAIRGANLDPVSEPAGTPSVPYLNALIEVPANATGFAVAGSCEAWHAVGTQKPVPVREPVVVGEALGEPVEDAAAYASVWPSATFEQGEKMELGGKTYLPVRVKVFRWNGPKGTLEALTALDLSVECTLPRTTLKLTTAAVPTEKTDYVVISPPNFVDYWQDFVDYRRTTHANMTFDIVSTADIYAQYETGDDQLKIHHFIEDLYKQGTRYVLLGAGAQHTSYDKNTMIPTRIAVTRDFQTQSCDYYYCVVEKPEGAKEVWDYNGDGIYLASRNPNGGYWADATSQFSWAGAMMVHRFPARASISMGGKTKTAEEQIRGYVNKLKRAEQGTFAGRFCHAVHAATLKEEYDRYHGNTSAECTQERQFYDLGANIFSEEHGNVTALNEYETRERSPSYYTLKRPVGTTRSVLQRYYKNGETPADFYARDFDSMLINSHGSPDAVDPLTHEGVWTSTGLSRFHILIVPCHAGNPCAGANNVVSISEAGVVNPDGGSLVSYGNSHFGLWGGKDTLSEKIERDVIKMLYACQDGDYHNAGEARLWALNNYKWNGLAPNSGGGMLMCDSMAYGDPLVKLSPIWSRNVDADGTWRRGDQSAASEPEYASTLTIDAGAGDMTLPITNEVGAAWLNVNGSAGKTLTLKGSGKGHFKVTNKVTVNDGMTLNWEVPGGFGRNGINFAGGGNLRIRAAGYYGIDFRNVGELAVTPPGGTAILDFDSKNYFRNGDGYIKTLTVGGPSETIFRSRQAGIFSTNFTVSVNGGTLTLETPCVGGSGVQSSATPLFRVKDATLAVRPNPNWAAECFSRRVAFENGTLASRYDKFYLGANAGGHPGLDVTVDGPDNVFEGPKAIRLNGQLRLHSTTGGTVNVTAELVNGSGAGALALGAGVTAKLAAVNAFSGGITVPNGARLVVDNVRGLGSGAVVVQDGATLQINAMPLAGVKSVTLQSGAKLVLKSSGGASYQMYSPAETSFSMAADVKVYDSADEGKALEGIVTPEGAYFISDAAKAWRGQPLTWSSTSAALAWETKGVPTTYSDGDTVLFKDVSGVAKTTVYTSGEVNPGMVAFQNSATAYTFEGKGASIAVGSMATSGETAFEPTLKATTQISIGGKTTASDITTPVLNVAGGGALNVSGTVDPVPETIGVIRFYCTETMRFGHCVAGEAEYPMEISELRCYSDANGQSYLFFPVGTVITDSKGNSVKITGMSASGTAYVFGEESGDTTLKNLFDGSTSTTHAVKTGTTGPWWICITLPNAIPMFKSFQFGTGPGYTSKIQYYAFLYPNHPSGNPYKWTLQVGKSANALTTVVDKASGQENASKLSWTGVYKTDALPITSRAIVQDGGTLYLNGTYNMPVTINAGATLAVTNDARITFAKVPTVSDTAYSICVDTVEAKRTPGWTQVTSGGGFSSVWPFATEPDIAVKVEGGNLFIATENVMPPPYAATISGEDAAADWNGMGWTADGKAFGTDWSSVITKQTGSGSLTVAGTNMTLNVDCGVALDTLAVTCPIDCRPGLLTVNATGNGYANVSALDFRNYNGRVVWSPALASWGCNVYIGSNDVTVASMTGGKGLLQVSAGGRATVPQKFASYDVESGAAVRFTGKHTFAMGDLPARGVLSFDDATLQGSFQNALITYAVAAGDKLVFTGDGNNYNGRISSSFDIAGGTVTINSNGASTWFGINGETSFRQTGGTFLCTANGTGTSGNGSGLLLGYSASMTEDFAFDIAGGEFLVPNTSINFFGPARFALSSNALVRAKGVFRGSTNKGAVSVGETAVFEIGSIGLCGDSCEFNLFGGTLAGFENGANVNGAVTLGGCGTLAATNGTTLSVRGEIVADGATLNIGVKGRYEGTVKLSSLPAGVTNLAVSAGTLHLGALRPTDKTLADSAGAIAITLSTAQIAAAQTNAVRIIRATAVPKGGVVVYNKRGHLQDGTVAEIANGYLTVRTTTTVQSIADAKWNNTGNTEIGGIGTKADNGNYSGFTVNFGTNDNMVAKDIGGEGTLKLKKIRFGQRDGGANVPSALKVRQGELEIVSAGMTVNTAKDFVLYMYNYLSNNAQRYSFVSYDFTFAEDVALLDCTKDFTITFLNGSGETMNAGIRAMQPANSKTSVGGYSPCIEVIGDWEYDPGNALEDDTGGDSISINVIGGNANNRTGKRIASGTAGAYPIGVAGWNQLAERSNNNAFTLEQSNLTEVLADGSIVPSGVSATLSGACTYTAGTDTSNADAELEYGYIDDGGTGAEIVVREIPYTKYDVYVYMGSDGTGTSGSFGPVRVTCGTFTTNCPASGQAWGSAASTHGAVELAEGKNYFRVQGLSGSTLTVNGAVKGSPINTRCGIAGIQIVNTGLRGTEFKDSVVKRLLVDFDCRVPSPNDDGWQAIHPNSPSAALQGTAVSANGITFNTSISGGNIWEDQQNGRNELATDFNDAIRDEIKKGLVDDIGLSSELTDAQYESVVRRGGANGGVNSATLTVTISGLNDASAYNLYWAGGAAKNNSQVRRTNFQIGTCGTDESTCVSYVDAGGSKANQWQVLSNVTAAVSSEVERSTVLLKALHVRPVGGVISLKTFNDYNPMNFLALAEVVRTVVSPGEEPDEPELPQEDVAIGPLMGESWYQRDAYNQFSPVVNGGRSPAGCVATAFAQMFHHYQWPRYTYRTTEGPTTYGGGKTTLNLALDGRLPFAYEAMPDAGCSGELPAAYETGRFMIWVDALAKMYFDGSSGNADYHFPPEYASYWYEKGYEIRASDYVSNVAGAEALLVVEIEKRQPVQMTINGHQVVLDGWKTVAGENWFHVNFGWNNNETAWYSIYSSGGQLWIKPRDIVRDHVYITAWWAGMAPKKTVQVEPLPLATSNAFSLAWHFPDCHTNELTGFAVNDYALNGTVGDVDDTDVLAIPFDRAGYYPLEGVYGITADSTLSVTVESHNTTEISVVLEGRANGGAWTTLADVPLSTAEYNPKDDVDTRLSEIVSPDLSAFAGTTAEFRLKTVRGEHSSDRASAGEYIRRTAVHFANVEKWTKTAHAADAADRSISLADLSAGYHAFTVVPMMADGDGVASESVGTTVVADAAAVPEPPAIEEIVTMANPMANELVRCVKPGGMVFWVRGNASVTNVMAACSHRSFVPASAVKAHDAGNGWFAVALATAQDLPEKSQMILTLDAESANGDHALRDIVLSVSNAAPDDEEKYLIGAIESEDAVLVPPGVTNVLDAASPRRVVGMGTVVFKGVAPEQAAAGAFGFTDGIAWHGTVVLENVAEAQAHAAELKNGNSRLEYVMTEEPPTPPQDPGHFETTLDENALALDWNEYARFDDFAWNGEAYEAGVGNTMTVNVQGSIRARFDQPLTLEALTFVGTALEDYEYCHVELDVSAGTFDGVGKVVFSGLSAMIGAQAFGCDIELADGAGVTFSVPPEATEVTLTTGTIAIGGDSSVWIDDGDWNSVWVLNEQGNGFVKKVPGVSYDATKVEYWDGTNAYDITAAFTNGTDGAWLLDGTKSVEVKSGNATETISVTPVLSPIADDAHVGEEPFAVTDDSVAVGVKSIPGLAYRLMRGSEIGTYTDEADSRKATGPRLKLKDDQKPAGRAFYVIEVSRP